MQTVWVKSLNKQEDNMHIQPLLASTQLYTQVHQFDCEVDSGARCNIVPLYICRLMLRDKKPEPNTVLINAKSDSPVKNQRSCTAVILTGNQAPQKAVFQVTGVRGYLILAVKQHNR